MFGTGTNHAAPPANPNRPQAADVARLDGNYTQIIVSSESSDGIALFLNGQPVLTGQVESLTVEIIAPGDPQNPNGQVTAILSRHGGAGIGGQQTTALFPGTVELIGRGRRIIVTCLQPGSFDGLWLGLGLRADGTSSELTGVQSLRLAVAPGLLDAKLVWSEDGTTEDLLPLE